MSETGRNKRVASSLCTQRLRRSAVLTEKKDKMVNAFNQFIEDYLERLRGVSSDANVTALYHWFWDNQALITAVATEINLALGLRGEEALQPDLPCLTMGSRQGLLFLLVNPGWNRDLNPKEDSHCRKSRDTYVDYFFNYFTASPPIIGERIRYAASMISFIGVLRDGLNRLGHPRGTKERWRRANDTKLIGHWELFPFHSAEDGLTRHISQCPWLFSCIKESILAALRLQPETLLALSSPAHNLLRYQILGNQRWIDTQIGEPSTRLSYTVVSGQTRQTEIVSVPRQMLSTYRICTNQEVFDEVEQLRQAYSKEP